MPNCPICHRNNPVMPIMEAVKLGTNSPLMASEFGMMPAQRSSIGGRRIADHVIGQLKHPPSGVWSVVQQVVGAVLGIALALVGIPLFIFGLFRLISVNFLWLPVVLVLWLAGVVLLLARAMRPQVAPSAYRQALVRIADLSYCLDCDVIFETETGRVIPLEQLRDALYPRST